jgi:hypothetical protein
MGKKYVGEKIIGGINEAVRYLRAGAEATKKYERSSLAKHESAELNLLSPSERRKELERLTKQWKSEQVGREELGQFIGERYVSQRIMNAGISSKLGGAGTSARPAISERMVDNTVDLKKSFSDILWGSSGGKSLDAKNQIAKRLAQRLIGTRGRDVRTERISDKRNITYSEGKNPIKLEKSAYQIEKERAKLGKILAARRAGRLYAQTLKNELKHFFPNLSEKLQRQYVAKKMKGIGEKTLKTRSTFSLD